MEVSKNVQFSSWVLCNDISHWKPKDGFSLGLSTACSTGSFHNRKTGGDNSSKKGERRLESRSLPQSRLRLKYLDFSVIKKKERNQTKKKIVISSRTFYTNSERAALFIDFFSC